MKGPICPICGEPLEYDEMTDELFTLNDQEEKTFEGHCEKCRKVFQWVEVWESIGYYDIEEQRELE